MQKLPLPANWTVRAVSNQEEVPPEIQNRDIPAEVPGCVHLDLMREGLIPDPYLGCNEPLVQWIGRTDWEYRTTFFVSEEAMREERVDLVCEGLDTVATVWVNGIEVGKSENMHVESRFDIKAALVGTPLAASAPDDNGEDAASSVWTNTEYEIRIAFASPVFYARAMRDRLGDLPHANSYPDCEPFHFIRKNACNFGWDWGPALATSGIWKAIRLEAWSVARIKSVRPLVKVANEKVAVVDVVVEVEQTGDSGMVTVDGSIPYSKADRDLVMYENKATLRFYIPNPQLWWPRGYGEQNLTWLKIELHEHWMEDPPLLDTWKCKIGLREVELDQSPDDIGAKWALKVNGREIWCKGANWIPDDVFLTRAGGSERLRARLEQACAMNMNTIRVWGGGIYESDEFYAICDELGLLVWQDFPFACAAYSEESPMRELVEEEARQNVARLSKHPSLVLWNGCNENIWGWFDWGWESKCQGRTWGAGYYFDVLPSIVKELDPTRPYYPGSPFSGSMDIHPNSDQFGPKHLWDTWNEVNYTHFRRYSPRFASEFGHQAPPTFATLKRAVPDGELNPTSDTMLLHQKAAQGNAKLHARLLEWFEMPGDFDDWLYLTQLVQARAMTTAVEWFRTRESCRGALYWQLNDCWPATSWSAIDGDGRLKPLGYASKQFFQDRLLTIQPDGEHLALWAHNDSDESWFGEGTIRLLTMDGEEKMSDGFKIFVPARELVRVCQLDGFEPSDAQGQLLNAKMELGEGDCFWFFDSDKNLAYPEPKFEAELDGNELTITAQTLIRDIYLNADRIGGRAEVGLATLLSGQTWTVEIEGVSPDELDLETLTSRPVLMCANWFGRKS